MGKDENECSVCPSSKEAATPVGAYMYMDRDYEKNCSLQ
jgi:hypothetical protein